MGQVGLTESLVVLNLLACQAEVAAAHRGSEPLPI